MASASNVGNLVVDLARFGQSGEWEKALKITNRILHETPDDVKILQAKVVCYINLSQFQDGLNVITKNPKLSSELSFEKAYCLYRLNKINDAMQALQAVTNPSFKIKELKAQILYRLEMYEECFEAYRELIKTSQDDYEEERETNLSAVISNLRVGNGKYKDLPQARTDTYELCYNSACAMLVQGKYSEAIEKLKLAEQLCRKSLEDDEVAEDEIESELAIIRVQLGYAFQILGKNEDALKLYNLVVKQKPSDIGLLAVASNNIVSINKDQNVFDSKKRIKSATVEGLQHKLTTQQQKQIALNSCLLLMHTNQFEQGRTQVKKLISKYPDCEEAVLLYAAIYCREKQINKAIDVLREYGDKFPDLALNIRLTQAQLLLTQGHVSQACVVLRNLNHYSYTPGIVSALVTLYMSMEDKASATSVLSDAISWFKKNRPTARELTVLWNECANFHLRNNQTSLAIQCLEELRRSNPKDMKTLAQLITAYAKINPQKAQEISKELPPAAEVSQSIDVESLETSSWILGAKYVKKVGKTEPSPAVGKSDKVDQIIAKKKYKKKKRKLPKNYNPNVDPDPERWLPRRERSTYKKRKDKRGGVGRGTQGATGNANDIDATKMVPQSANSPRGVSSANTISSVPSPAQGPRQQRPQGGQKKKKKRGGK